MADGLCDWEGDGPHPRNHIITTLNPFSAVELCDDHYGPGLIPLLAGELGVDPGPFYANVERYLKAEQKRADKALAAAQAAEANQTGGEVQADNGGGGGGELPEPQFYPADGPAYSETGGDAA
jgi:hypothetical protein